MVPDKNNSRILTTAIDLEAEGDCFGILGGKKLIARTKNITDMPLVKQISAGDNFALALTSNGALFAWGEDSMLGHYELSPWRTPWFTTDYVARIACGRNHVVVATASGGAYSWGSNVYGQLGLGWKSSIMDPPVSEPVAIKTTAQSHQSHAPTVTATTGTVIVPDSDHVVLDVACGDDHSVLLLGSGQLLAFGNNWQGQLGIKPEDSDCGCVYEPTEVTLQALDEPSLDNLSASAAVATEPGSESPPPATKPRAYLISAYGATTAAVTTRGDVFVWGKCVPSGRESVCGLVSRWQPQLLDLSEAEEGDETKGNSGRGDAGERPVWHSIAIANGLVVLTKHTN